MSEQKKAPTPNRWRAAEMFLFLFASTVGIYALGQGLKGMFEGGQSINLLWLAVAGVALFILFAQMGRVHDSWPRRKPVEETGTKRPFLSWRKRGA